MENGSSVQKSKEVLSRSPEAKMVVVSDIPAESSKGDSPCEQRLREYYSLPLIDYILVILARVKAVHIGRPSRNKIRISSRGYYLETGPDPIAMVIRVELFIHKPC